MSVDFYERIESRYGFRVPALFREMEAAGHFDYKQPEKYIEFTDHEWMLPEDIANHEFCSWQTYTQTFFVPFSFSARRDEWGWRLDWASDEPPVVFCERGPEGHGFAPTFQAFLYRMLLEEFAGTWILETPDDIKGQASIRRSVEAITPHLPKHWQGRLEQLSKLTWRQEDGICVYSRAECDQIINEDLAFPHLGETFLQEIE